MILELNDGMLGQCTYYNKVLQWNAFEPKLQYVSKSKTYVPKEVSL